MGLLMHCPVWVGVIQKIVDKQKKNKRMNGKTCVKPSGISTKLRRRLTVTPRRTTMTISVVDPQKKLTTTLLLRPKLRLKRGWPRPKQWLGTNVPYNNIGLDPCRVAAKEKRKRYTEKSSFCRNLS